MQNPAFSFLHAGALAGVTITPTPAEDSDFPVARVVDSRISAPFKFGSSATDPDVEFNRGAGTLEAIDRLLLAPASNGSDLTVTVEHATSGGGPWSSIGSATWTDGAWLDLTLTSSTNRFVRVVLTGTGTFEFSEIILTRKRTLPEGWGDPDWDASPWPAVEAIELRGGWAGRVDIPARRRWSVRHQGASHGSDFDVFRELDQVTRSGLLPFWLDPPDDADAGAWVQGESAAPFRVTQDHPNPAGTQGPTYTVALTLVETVL